jgi:hypothetical protein
MVGNSESANLKFVPLGTYGVGDMLASFGIILSIVAFMMSI